jgi:hypothetical protein
MKRQQKRYIGDGVYGTSVHDGTMFLITTENGVAVTNSIYLEPEVAFELMSILKEWLEE